MRQKTTYPKAVKIWLITGLVLIFVQVIVGGITRLTGSGLSITRWEIVTGTLPPLNETQWEEAFELYRATPQYQKLNEGMSMSDFKFIYFWEYVHRLWARMMGFVFVLPLALFVYRGWIDRRLGRRLIVVFLLAALTASFGWIMVSSGLVNRPWVNAYKLTMHLGIALALFAYLLWTTLLVLYDYRPKAPHPGLYRGMLLFLGVLVVQLILGGMMSGMKAALSYPTWPDMGGRLIPSVVLEGSSWVSENFVQYDRGSFMVSLVQFAHRMTAYLLLVLGGYLFYHIWRRVDHAFLQSRAWAWIAMLGIQVVLGIWTLVRSVGQVPVDLGVFHQGGALLLLAATLVLVYHLRGKAVESV